MKNKIINKERIKDLIKSGDTIMYSGFLGVGSPETIIGEIINSKIDNLTIIGNDTAKPNVGVSRLIANNQVKKVIASHIGTNPLTGQLMSENKMEVDLVPQGTLIERIRAGGFGLGGILTKTGIGTDIEKGKQIIKVDGENYLLEKPLRARVSIIKGSIVDKAGNIYYLGTTRNFAPLVATASDIVIVEAEKLVEIGEISPEQVMTQGIFVDYIVEGE